MSFKFLGRGDSATSLGSLFQGSTTFCEEFFPVIQPRPCLAQLEAFFSCPIASYLGEKANPHLATASLWGDQLLSGLGRLISPWLCLFVVICRLRTRAMLLSAVCLCIDIWRGICIFLVKTLKNINVVLFSQSYILFLYLKLNLLF